MQGHYNVLELLIKYPYPRRIMLKFTDKTGNYDYELPFDFNAKDVSGTFNSKLKIFHNFPQFSTK